MSLSLNIIKAINNFDPLIFANYLAELLRYLEIYNNVDNLEWVTNRENTHHYEKNQNRSSKYIGVSWDKDRSKWTSKIKVNGKTINLGRFENELDAYKKYLNYAKTEGLSSSYS